MTSGQPEYAEIGVNILTSIFQARGKLHVLGTMQNFLNDEQKPTLSVIGAEVIGIDHTNPAARMSQPELIINKRAIQAIALDTAPPPGSLVMLSKVEHLVLYTDQFAIAGRLHMGPDAHLADFAEASLQQFIVASDVKIYPLFQARQGIVQAAPVVVIHKSQIRLYHKA